MTTVPFMAERTNFKIMVDHAEKNELTALLERLGVKHQEAMTKTIRFLLKAQPAVRMGMWGLLDEKFREEVAALAIAESMGWPAVASPELREAVIQKLEQIKNRTTAAIPPQDADNVGSKTHRALKEKNLLAPKLPEGKKRSPRQSGDASGAA